MSLFVGDYTDLDLYESFIRLQHDHINQAFTKPQSEPSVTQRM